MSSCLCEGKIQNSCLLWNSAPLKKKSHFLSDLFPPLFTPLPLSAHKYPVLANFWASTPSCRGLAFQETRDTSPTLPFPGATVLRDRVEATFYFCSSIWRSTSCNWALKEFFQFSHFPGHQAEVTLENEGSLFKPISFQSCSECPADFHTYWQTLQSALYSLTCFPLTRFCACSAWAEHSALCFHIKKKKKNRATFKFWHYILPFWSSLTFWMFWALLSRQQAWPLHTLATCRHPGPDLGCSQHVLQTLSPSWLREESVPDYLVWIWIKGIYPPCLLILSIASVAKGDSWA